LLSTYPPDAPKSASSLSHLRLVSRLSVARNVSLLPRVRVTAAAAVVSHLLGGGSTGAGLSAAFRPEPTHTNTAARTMARSFVIFLFLIIIYFIIILVETIDWEDVFL
jgi:hypothetical protein